MAQDSSGERDAKGERPGSYRSLNAAARSISSTRIVHRADQRFLEPFQGARALRSAA
jgi:hypothetical protein